MKKIIKLPVIFIMAAAALISCRNETRQADDLDDDINTTTTTGTLQDDGFAQFDTDRDDRWNENEFSESYQAEFSGYDTDTAGSFNQEQFSAATFRSVDRDRNNSISRQEWDEGYNNSFGDHVNQDDFDRFDTDQSGDLSDAEWNEGFRESNWFGTYDQDQNQTVSRQEWNRANFSRWDRNGDGYLDRQEFDAYNRAMAGNNSMNSANRNQSQNQNNRNQNNQNQNQRTNNQ